MIILYPLLIDQTHGQCEIDEWVIFFKMFNFQRVQYIYICIYIYIYGECLAVSTHM